jgi:hypothetical protein
MNRKTSTLIGAGLGLVLFLAVAMLPAMLYGGYAGVLLAGGIFGTPLAPTFLVRTLIIGGMILGTVGIASLFTVLGAVVGGGVSVLTEIPGKLVAAVK